MVQQWFVLLFSSPHPPDLLLLSRVALQFLLFSAHGRTAGIQRLALIPSRRSLTEAASESFATDEQSFRFMRVRTFSERGKGPTKAWPRFQIRIHTDLLGVDRFMMDPVFRKCLLPDICREYRYRSHIKTLIMQEIPNFR
jgi:hypothetical protein